MSHLRFVASVALTAALLLCIAAEQGRCAAIPTSGLTVWFKADSITGVLNGGSVGTWNDSSANLNNATAQSGSPTYNTGTLASNNQPYVTFPGTATRLQTGSNLGISGDITTTVFAVFRPVSVAPTSTNGVFSWGDPFGGPATTFGMLNDFDATGAGSPQIQFGGGRRVFFTAGTETTNFQIAQISKSPGALNTTTTLRWDGQNIAVAGSPASQNNTPNVTDTKLVIGNWGEGIGTPLNGDIAELIVYTGVLGADDSNIVGSYLASKYGISSTYEAPEPSCILSLLPAALLMRRANRKVHVVQTTNRI